MPRARPLSVFWGTSQASCAEVSRLRCLTLLFCCRYSLYVSTCYLHGNDGEGGGTDLMVSLPKCGIIALPPRSSAETWTAFSASVGGGRGVVDSGPAVDWDVKGAGGGVGRTTYERKINTATAVANTASLLRIGDMRCGLEFSFCRTKYRYLYSFKCSAWRFAFSVGMCHPCSVVHYGITRYHFHYIS